MTPVLDIVQNRLTATTAEGSLVNIASRGARMAVDWEQRVDFDRLRKHRMERAKAVLDGSELGLKYGTGGGLRWAAGKSFVLRFDVAWSPDADPVGAYLAAGHTF